MIRGQGPESGPVRKFFAIVAGAILIVAGFMFSLVLLAFITIAGAIAFGVFWWKTRAVRRVLREGPPDGQEQGNVIEGEVVVVEDYEAQSAPPSDKFLK